MKKFCSIALFVSLFQMAFSFEVYPHIQSRTTPITRFLKPVNVTEKKSGIKGIDCIYVINLDSRPDRWERTKALLDEKGLKVNRMSAVNGWQLTHDDMEAMSGPYPVHMKGGEYGCLLSHVSILKDAQQRRYRCIWILEDDIEILDELERIPETLSSLNRLDKEWDIFYTDCDFRNVDGAHMKSYHYSQRPDQPLFPYAYYQMRPQVSNDIMQVRNRWGTTSMIYSKNGIKKVLDYFTHVYLYSPIDHDVHTIPTIREYAPYNDIVSNWSHSIDSDTKSPTSDALLQENMVSSEDPFWNCYQLAQQQENENSDPNTFLSTYLTAHSMQPHRAEPLYRIGSYYRRSGDLASSYLILKQALALPYPEETQKVEQWMYNYGLLMELSLTAFYLNRFDECKQLSQQLLENQALPRDYQKAAIDNLVWVDKKVNGQ